MLPIIAGIALVGAGIFIAEMLEEESNNERDKWKMKQAEVEKSIEWHNEQIKKHFSKAQHSCDLKTLVDIHDSCLKVVDQTYLLLKDARNSLDKIDEAIVKTKDQKTFYLEEKKKTKSLSKIRDFQEKIDDIEQTENLLLCDKNKIIEQRDIFLTKIKDLNDKIIALNTNIRNITENK